MTDREDLSGEECETCGHVGLIWKELPFPEGPKFKPYCPTCNTVNPEPSGGGNVADKR